MKIEIASNQDCYPINKRKIRQVVTEVLREESQIVGRIPGLSLSIAFVDNEKIAELNRKFLGHEGPTDVISFPLDDETLHPDSVTGEIVVSAQMAQETANAMHTDVETELILYVIHGLLHLIGYDDTTSKEAQSMHKRERELLALLGNRE